MKTIKPLDGYKFKRLIRYNNKLYLISHSFINNNNLVSYYLLDIITEERCLTASYTYREYGIVFQDRVFAKTNYRIDEDLYVTKYYPLVVMIPFAYPDSSSYKENLGLDLLEGVIVSTKSTDRKKMSTYGHRFCHSNHLACISKRNELDDDDTDALVIQHNIKYIGKFGSNDPKEVIIYQPQHGMPKIFKIPHHAGTLAIHPTEPLAIIWDEEFCTIIDLEL